MYLPAHMVMFDDLVGVVTVWAECSGVSEVTV